VYADLSELREKIQHRAGNGLGLQRPWQRQPHGPALLVSLYEGVETKEMKCPCVQQCPDRSMRCRSSCAKFKEYLEWQEAKREEDRQAFIVRDYIVNSVLHVKKVRRI